MVESSSSSWALLENGQLQDHIVTYTNARVIDPESGTDYVGFVITKGKEIEDFGPGEPNCALCSMANERIDCGGSIIMPGIIDPHVHFREPGGEHKETVDTGSMAAAAGGVTTVVCQPNTAPRIETVLVAKYLKMRALESSCVNIEFYGAVTQSDGSICDMPSLKNAGAVGFTDDGLPVMNALIMKRAFEYSSMLNAVVAQHAEDCNLSNGGCINEGRVSRELGLKGIPDISESIMVSRDIQLLREVPGARYHVLHISTKKALDVVRQAKKEGLNVTCEVTPHHLLLTEDAILEYGPMAKMNPPLRTEEDRISLLEGVADGTIDCLATDHAPHAPSEKTRPIDCCAFGIVGLETLLPLSLELCSITKKGLIDILAMLTVNTANILRLEKGRIKKGLAADLTIFDPSHEWTIDTTKFSSKSKNSPFNNRQVKGKVLRTVVAGKTVYRASS